MCHDGSRTASEIKEGKEEGGSEEGIISNVPEDRSAYAFRAMILWLTLLGFNVALVNEVEFRDTKVRNVHQDNISCKSELNYNLRS